MVKKVIPCACLMADIQYDGRIQKGHWTDAHYETRRCRSTNERYQLRFSLNCCYCCYSFWQGQWAMGLIRGMNRIEWSCWHHRHPGRGEYALDHQLMDSMTTWAAHVGCLFHIIVVSTHGSGSNNRRV